MLRWPVVKELARRPSLWPEAVRTYAAVVPPRWWAKPPFLPVPDRAWLRWRIATAYGNSDAPVEPQDVVAYLRWRRHTHHAWGAERG